ncbi:MAG: transposase [Candidatus Lokiarchaeota archaeon]|nr:transposase [Candidatus Harpocratesius repetitus]
MKTMGDKCPSCGKAELVEMIPGLRMCPSCNKMFRSSDSSSAMAKESIGIIKEGEYFMNNTSLNPKWEIAEKGITIFREKNKSWMAVLLCHSPSFESIKYIRLSWWKKSINSHAGMFKIQDIDVLENTIIALKRIDAMFDDSFNVKAGTTIDYDPVPERVNFTSELPKFNETKRICPKCGRKMNRSSNKRFYECERCGEIVIMEEGKPIIDLPASSLPLAFSSNFPINYYLPDYGISVKIGMADWKAIVIIHAKENPEKKWLRFYWWTRNLQQYMTNKYSLGSAQGLRWETKKGLLSPNIYEKAHIPRIIDALEKMREEWLSAKKK